MEIEKENNKRKEIKERYNRRIDRIYEQKYHKKICGISLWRILGYIVIYSFIGYLIEVIYGLATEGVLESRQSFLYGPFCAIYGVGAVLMLLPMNKIKSNNKIIYFLVAGLIGCTFEYLVSWFGEVFLHSKWWDYSEYFLNINGRVCLYFGIFWGLLGLFLKYILNPRVDSLIDKLKVRSSRRKQYIIVLLTMAFLVADCAVSIIAMEFFQARAIHEKNIDAEDAEYYESRYQVLYKNEYVGKMINLLWSDEVMLKTYPNMKITLKNGEVDYYSNYYPEIQCYYFKVFEPKPHIKEELPIIVEEK